MTSAWATAFKRFWLEPEMMWMPRTLASARARRRKSLKPLRTR